MAIQIKITHKEYNKLDLVNYMEHTTQLIDQGYKKGEDWELLGESENYDDDPEDDEVDELEDDDIEIPI